jgi:hypothetical protein
MIQMAMSFKMLMEMKYERYYWSWMISTSSIEMQSKPFHQVDDTPFAGDAANTILYNIIGYTDMSKGA